jgi:hypothetical protein
MAAHRSVRGTDDQKDRFVRQRDSNIFQCIDSSDPSAIDVWKLTVELSRPDFQSKVKQKWNGNQEEDFEEPVAPGDNLAMGDLERPV